MGIAILVIIGAVAAFGVFAHLALSRSGQQQPRHIRGVRNHDSSQYGSLWHGSLSSHGGGGWSHGGGGWSHGGGGWSDGGGWSGGGSCGGDGGGGSC